MSWWRALLERRRLAKLRARLEPTDSRIAAYLRDYRPPEQSVVLDQVRFVVVDTEATGLEIESDRILTVAAIAVRGRALHVEDSLELTIAHDRVGRDAAPIHGMVTEDLEEGDEEREVIGRFLEFLGSDVLVAHHAGFDHGILSAASKRQGGPELLNLVLDTEWLARRIELGPMNTDTNLRFSLDAVAERFGLETDARHTAAGDTLLTAELLVRLIARMDRHHRLTLRQLL